MLGLVALIWGSWSLRGAQEAQLRAKDRRIADSVTASHREAWAREVDSLAALARLRDSAAARAERRAREADTRAAAPRLASQSARDSLAAAQSAVDSLAWYPVVVDSLVAEVEGVTLARDQWRTAHDSVGGRLRLALGRIAVDSTRLEAALRRPPIVIREPPKSRGFHCLRGAGPVLTVSGTRLGVGVVCGW